MIPESTAPEWLTLEELAADKRITDMRARFPRLTWLEAVAWLEAEGGRVPNSLKEGEEIFRDSLKYHGAGARLSIIYEMEFWGEFVPNSAKAVLALASGRGLVLPAEASTRSH